MTPHEMIEDFAARTREARAREAMIAEIGAEEYERRQKEREWQERLEAESAALNPGGTETVRLDDGTELEIREPRALAWARALSRILKAIKPLTALWGATQSVAWKQLTAEQQIGAALNIIAQYGADDIEATAAALMTVADAMLGREDGWLGERATIEDVARVLLALMHVTAPGRYRYFFGQLGAALTVQARAVSPAPAK